MNNQSGTYSSVRHSHLLQTFEKSKEGEGSKGGKVIGHTKSGKPIYEEHNAYDDKNKDYDDQDHKDAAKAHMEKYDKHKGSTDPVKEKKAMQHYHIAKTHAKKGGFLDGDQISHTIKKGKDDADGKPLKVTQYDLNQKAKSDKHQTDFNTHFDNAMNMAFNNPVQKNGKEFLEHMNNAAQSYAELRKSGVNHNTITTSYHESKGDKMNEYWKKHSSGMMSVIESKHDKWQKENEEEEKKNKPKKDLKKGWDEFNKAAEPVDFENTTGSTGIHDPNDNLAAIEEVLFQKLIDHNDVLMKAATDDQKAKLKKVFDEYGKGELHSGSKKGPKVTSHKQAVAIALHESGLAKSVDEADKMLKGYDDDMEKSQPVSEFEKAISIEWNKSMDDENMIEKAKAVAIGTVDKQQKYVKTNEGWKPLSTHSHLVDRNLDANKRHFKNQFNHLTLDDFKENKSPSNGKIFDKDKYRRFQDNQQPKKGKMNIDKVHELDQKRQEEANKKKKELGRHMKEVEEHNNKK